MTTLLLAEHDNIHLKEATAKALTAARQLGGDVHLLVAGSQCRSAAEEAARLDGVARILVADALPYEHFLPEPVAELLVSLASGYDALMAPSTANGRNIMPRVAASLDVMQISDMMKVVGPDTFERPIFAGNVIETVRSHDSKKVFTVRITAFQATGNSGAAPIEAIETIANPGTSSVVSEELIKSDRPELATAKIIISGGRALQSQENFTKYIEPIADQLHAAMGASRAAVDAGFAPNDWQVGQTGKIVAPELYIAVGISGAIQHLAGMKDSKVIVAINKDADAPIFGVADYGIVGDLYQILPELSSELTKNGH
jgi:electron transfer flavoprotein alpha subunit